MRVSVCAKEWLYWKGRPNTDCWHIDGQRETPTWVDCALKVGSVSHTWLLRAIQSLVPMDSDRWIQWGAERPVRLCRPRLIAHCPTASRTWEQLMTRWRRSQNCSLGREVSGRWTEEPSPEGQKGSFSHLVSFTWLTASEQTQLWGGVIFYSFLSSKSKTTIGTTSKTFSKQPLSRPLLLVPATASCLIWPMVRPAKCACK